MAASGHSPFKAPWKGLFLLSNGAFAATISGEEGRKESKVLAVSSSPIAGNPHPAYPLSSFFDFKENRGRRLSLCTSFPEGFPEGFSEEDVFHGIFSLFFGVIFPCVRTSSSLPVKRHPVDFLIMAFHQK